MTMVWHYSEDAAYVESDEDVYCLPLRDERCSVVKLEGTAAHIWCLLSNRTTEAVLTEMSGDGAPLSADAARAVVHFIDDLQSRGLIVDR